MSVILLWENPEKVTDPLAKRAQVFRKVRDAGSGIPSGSPMLIEESSTWGFYEDKEVSHPDQYEYQVKYVDGHGGVQAMVDDVDIRKSVRPNNVAIVTYEPTEWTGLPDGGRTLEVSNEDEGGSLYMRFLTNPEGVARFPARWGARVKIRINNELKALDVVIPAKPDITFRTLQCFGTTIDFDRRGWY